MKAFVESSALTRLLANLFIFLILISSLCIASYEVLKGQPINPYASTLLGAGISYGMTLLGVHFGAVTATGLPVPPPLTLTPVEQLEQPTVKIQKVSTTPTGSSIA